MNSKGKIENYLEKYEELWYTNEGDIALNIIDDNPEDYYGWKLTGKYRMMMLFFHGQSNCFPGIWIGNDDHDDDLEKCPIYFCDIPDDTEPICEGNFKLYMKNCLNRLKEDNESNISIDNAIKDLDTFSDEILDYGEKFTRDKVEQY